MAHEHAAKLIAVRYEPDGLNQMVPVETSRQVLCRKESVSQSEWYRAGVNGLKPQHKLTMFHGDYAGETIVELDGVRYSVYRTYLAKHDRIELYLEKKAGV